MKVQIQITNYMNAVLRLDENSELKDVYILIVENFAEKFFCVGWIYGHEAMQIQFLEFNKDDNKAKSYYVIPHSALHDMSSLKRREIMSYEDYSI